MNKNHIYIDEIDSTIIRFLKQHHLLTLATSNDDKPYCCSCFYVYNDKENYFLVTSDNDTRHISEVLKQSCVSCAIALETTMVGKIQGIQFTGTMRKIGEADSHKEKTAYIKRFPVAVFSELLLWRIEPDFIKFTDNRLGFGKKMIWKKNN